METPRSSIHPAGRDQDGRVSGTADLHLSGQPRLDRPEAAAFVAAQDALLARCGVDVRGRFVPAPSLGGRTHVLVAGEGPPLVMVIGGMITAAFWAPLLPHLSGHTVYAVDLPGFGLTSPVEYRPGTLRSVAVRFLRETLDGLGIGPAPFVTQSQGSLWALWLAADDPDRVTRQSMVATPAHVLGTTAPAPMRLMSLGPLGRLMLRLQPPSAGQARRVFAAVREDVSDLPEVVDLLVACERLPWYPTALLSLMRTVMRRGRARPDVVLTEEHLAQVRHPVQLVWGERDPFGSVAVGRRIDDALPVSEFHVVAGGHAPWFDGAHEVGELVRGFLGPETR